MSRRKWAVAAVLMAVVIFAMLPAVANAALHTNEQCLECHGPDGIMKNANFVAPAVDMTACRKCHLDSLVGSHPIHFGGGNCGACHAGRAASLGAYVPTKLTSYGAFASLDSTTYPASIIHQVHSNPRWMNLSNADSKCASCHGVAACSTCHSGALANDHAYHGDVAYGFLPTTSPVATWTGGVSVGVVSSQAEDTYVASSSNRCGGPNCHDIAGASTSDVPTPHETTGPNGVVSAAVSYTSSETGGAALDNGLYFKKVQNAAYSGGQGGAGQSFMMNRVGTYLNFTFTGQKLTIIADRDPFRGNMEVTLDGVVQPLVDLYSASTQYKQPVWSVSDLSTATAHTVRVRAEGSRNASARGNWVNIDRFDVSLASQRIYGSVCGECHVSEWQDEHGGEHTGGFTFPHDASPTVSPTLTVKAGASAFTTGATAVYGTYACNACHKPLLRDEHIRGTNSATRYGSSCTACHYATLMAPTVWSGTYNVGTNACSYSTCHPSSASTRTAHASYSSVHATVAPVVAESAACQKCHYGTLVPTHNNTITAGTTSNCLSCHNATTNATTRDCADSGCHTATNHSLLTSGGHGFNTTRHTAANFTRAYQTTSTLDDGGLECNLCHSSQLDLAHSTPGTMTAVSCSTGGQYGKGCHLDNNYNSMNVARTTWSAGAYSTSGWASDKCTECHNYNGKKSHNTTSTPHIVTSNNGCANSGSGCHNSNDLWVLHLTNQAGGPKNYSSCANTNCHDASKINKRPTLSSAANPCGSTSTGCHTDKTTSHVGAYQHGFTATSQYSALTEQGCTNQTGCHDDGGSSTADFAAVFHPASGCTGGTCHAPANPSFDAFNTANTLPDECVECHATGLYSGAAARSNLTATLASGGHYSETTHTASGNTSTTAIAYNSGSASATCGNCHNWGRGLLTQHTNVNAGVAGSPYGSTIGCGECHGDARAKGNVEVVANWTNNTCQDCHAAGTTSQLLHATGAGIISVTESGSSCGNTGLNCHPSTDLHELHKNSSLGCNLTGCHNYNLQANMPTDKACGGANACHNGYTNTTHKHATDAAKHQPTTSTQASVTTYAGIGCGVCHDIRPAQSSLTSEHALTTSVGYTTVCATCHNNGASTTAITNNWSAKDTATACSVCHASGSMAIHTDASATAHTVATNTGCGNTGIGCHPTNDISSAGATATAANTVIHRSCNRCHDRLGATAWSSAQIGASSTLVYAPAVKACGQATGCHTSALYNNTSYKHRIGRADEASGTDTLHHVATAASMASALTSGTATATCASCHSDGLSLAHKVTSTTANLTSGHTAWTNVCTGCHNENRAPVADSANQVKTNWATDRCMDCHTAYHDVLNSGHVGTSTQGCTTSGAGCHNTNDLRALHSTRADGCTLAGCHDQKDKAMTGLNAKKGCGSGSDCHNTANYTDKLHGAITTGNEVASHETTVTGFSTDITGGTYVTGPGNTCAGCHSRGLATAHKATSTTASLRSGNPAWNAGDTGGICYDCHNTTTPDNSVNVIKTTGWTAKTCQQCHGSTQGTNYHNDYGTAHSVSSFGSCAIGTCHGAVGGIVDVRAVHDRATSGCTVSGAGGQCHQLDKPMPQSGMSCGNGAATGLACHTGATYISGGHGGSNGGLTCNTPTCHDQTQFTSMVASSGAFHHVLDDASPYAGPAAGSYSTNKDTLQCVSCHADHNYFNANKGANLRTSINQATTVATNTDFIRSGDGGICVSCHSTQRTKSTAQKVSSQDSSVTPTITIAAYAGSAHDYSINTTFGTSTFKANCSKCHDDEWDATSKMGGTYKIGTHTSADDRLTKALGVVLTGSSTEAGENLCYKCHGNLTGYDAYGSQVMTTSAQNVQAAFAKTYRHAVATSTAAGKHRSDEYDQALASVTGQTPTGPGWWGASNALRHGECEDCHNVHQATRGRTAWPENGKERGSSLPTVSPAAMGVWGVKIDGPTNASDASGNWTGSGTFGSPKFPTYSKIATSAYEWQLCLKCHSRYAWGNVATPTATTGDYTGAAATLTDVGKDFDPKNYAVHPLFTTGKNQPPTNANALWDSSTARRNINGVTTGNGLSNTFVDGWLSTSRVTCADCHGNDSWGSAGTVGPHGSSQRWILRGSNPNIKTTQQSGTVTLNSAVSGYNAAGFCTNCHRADIYGFGFGDLGANKGFSRAHGGINASCNDVTKLPKAINGCFNCHGGRVNATGQQANGAMHGSSMGNGPDTTPKTVAPLPAAMGYRFMNGASWIQHGLGDTDANVGCQTIAATDSYSSCAKHNSTSATKWGVTGGTAYTYARPTN